MDRSTVGWLWRSAELCGCGDSLELVDRIGVDVDIDVVD